MQSLEEDRGAKISELLAYLRESEGPKPNAAELAERFGLEREFVARLLGGIRAPKSAVKKPKGDRRDHLLQIASAWLAKSIESKPLLYVILSFFLWIVLAAVTKQLDTGSLTAPSASQDNGTSFSFTNISQFLLFMALVSAHGAIYFRAGVPLLPAKGAVAIALPIWLLSAIELAIEPHKGAASTSQRIAIYFFAFLIMGVLYAGSFALVSVWGAVLRQKRTDAKLSRQQLLQRYVELNDRLKHSVADYVPKPHRFQSILTYYRNSPYTWATFLGLFYALLTVGASAYSGINPYDPQFAANPGPKYILLLLPLALLSIVTFAALCYFAGSAKRAAVVALIFTLVNDVCHFFISRGRPYATTMAITTRHHVYKPNILVDMGINLVGQVVLAAAIGAASTLGERKLRERKILANDEATLASELLNIQMRLTEQPTRVYIMVVDAVGSTAMKAGVDTLTAEYAFRVYQQWIARVSSLFRGTLHSTAGDGAIVAFSTADEALNSASELQRDIERFNRDENKLGKPFRIRIGLHAGAVGADLRVVQFTRVIDIAAHIQKVSPIGGIALSAEFLAETSALAVQERNEEIDGSKIYTVSPDSLEPIVNRQPSN